MGQARLDLLQPAFYVVDNFQCVGAVSHDNDSRYHVSGAIEVACSASQIGTNDYLSNVSDPNRASVDRGKDGFFQIARRLEVAMSPNHVFGAAEFQQTRTALTVARGDSVCHPGYRNAVGSQPVGIDVDLILLGESSDGSHIGDTRNCL